ncbi:MAG: hypothetical protein O4861_14735 [Trichodesmium sp. St16_bin4-tuft]|nr:hypothetical protein [Trichodesmium sp. St16_bin4-tuft]
MTQMTTIETFQMSNYDDRIIEIEVTGVCRQDVKRVSTYKKKVSHKRMNQALREIYSLGGKIVSVTLLGESQATQQPVETLEESIAIEPPVQTLEESTAIEPPVQTLEESTAIEPPVQTSEESPATQPPVETLEESTAIEPPVETLEESTATQQPVETLEESTATQQPVETDVTLLKKSLTNKQPVKNKGKRRGKKKIAKKDL